MWNIYQLLAGFRKGGFLVCLGAHLLFEGVLLAGRPWRHA
jgi:hypothetical protein